MPVSFRGISIRFFEMDDGTGRKGENIRTAVPFVRQITQDGKPKLEVYRPTTNPIYIYTQVNRTINSYHEWCNRLAENGNRNRPMQLMHFADDAENRCAFSKGHLNK